MRWRIAGIALLLAWAALAGREAALLKAQSSEKSRTLHVGGTGGRPALTLHVSANGAKGIVEVQDKPGSVIQNLTCSFAAGQGEAVAKLFVENFAAEDLDMDGYADLHGTREFGAKWGRDCVWMYDAESHSFYKSFLAEQLELLSNLNVDVKNKRIVSSTIGPTNPSEDVYGISARDDHRPHWRQLVPTVSCLIETPSVETSPLSEDSVVAVTHYEKGRSVTERRRLGANFRSVLEAHGWCQSFE